MGNKILVVENDKRWQDALRQMLKKHPQFEVHVASSCEEAEELLRNIGFAAVTLNMNLSVIPEMTNDQLGFDLLELLQGQYASTPRIVLTGEINGPILSTYLPFGVSDVLYKRTVTRFQLVEAIEKAIGQTARPRRQYNRLAFCNLLDSHSTLGHVRQLQQMLKDRYPGEVSLSSYDNIGGVTKYEKLDSILEILETYKEIYIAGQVMIEIKPEDQVLRDEIQQIEWA